MKKDRGFIEIIVIVILALAAAKYFLNWDIFDAASTTEGQGTIAYIKNVLATIWSYAGTPIVWIWHEIVWPILALGWESLQELVRNRGFDISPAN